MPSRASRRSSGSSGPGPSGPPSASPCPVAAGRSRPWRAATRVVASGSARSSRASGRSPSRRRSSTRSSWSSWPSPTTPSRRWPASLRMYSGQAMVHTSGALDADVLAPAMAAGTQIGAFHPARRLRRHRAGGRGAPRRDGRHRGRRPARRAPGRDGRGDRGAPGPAGRRARRPPTTPPRSSPPAGSSRCSTRSPSSGRVAGLDEAGALAIYGPLIEGTLGNARALGVRAALTGPIARGDVGTLEAHLAALRAHAPDVLDLYRAVGRARGRPRRVAGHRCHRSGAADLRAALARVD